MEYFDIMRSHIQNLHRSISNPSEQTLAAWCYEDARHELLQDFEPQDEDDTLAFTSEVTVK